MGLACGAYRAILVEWTTKACSTLVRALHGEEAHSMTYKRPLCILIHRAMVGTPEYQPNWVSIIRASVRRRCPGDVRYWYASAGLRILCSFFSNQKYTSAHVFNKTQLRCTVNVAKSPRFLNFPDGVWFYDANNQSRTFWILISTIYHLISAMERSSNWATFRKKCMGPGE